MAESHIVSGLIKKRAELLGEIDTHQKEIQRISATLSHVDHTIKLFSPEFDLRTIKAKRINKNNQYFNKGELQSLVLNCMRDTVEPMTCKQIENQILSTKSINNALDVNIEPNILIVLKRLQGNGIVICINNQRPYLWGVAD
ncbi:hypothetical protein EXU29_15245 [Acinetobacter wuhouensis]|uniref:hypothetical protein n=1 Tax=Acinetobacter wuhouensis TaxID=1879050 RepID=UPI001023A05D|nr:hypothetical protein [Acinetobacter wuhouensis]RZG71116.1 hypothetical protein EXU29_15245 [Acinetobacter wuhouensis]